MFLRGATGLKAASDASATKYAHKKMRAKQKAQCRETRRVAKIVRKINR
jgi:hypothetical protein